MPRSDEEELAELWASFDAAQKLSLRERIERGTIHTFKPVLDEGPGYRSWETMADYQRWCAENLPEWLGYRKVTDEEWQAILDRALESDEEES